MNLGTLRACGIVLALSVTCGLAQASVFTGIEYGRDGDRALLLDVRTPSKPGPFPVWVEWVERDASPLIVPDREIHAADTVLIRAVMPSRIAARREAAAQLLRWLPTSISGYGGDPERAAMIVRGTGAQALMDLWTSEPERPSTSEEVPRGVRALILVEPPASLRGHRNWPDLPLLLIDAPARAGSLWRTALALRNQGIAAEPVVQDDLASASLGLSAHIAAMLAASDVPRVQRFDQLAFDAPIVLQGRVLDATRHGTGVVALLWNGRGPTLRLVSIDAAGTATELRRWPWRDDARLVAIDGRLLAIGSDAQGRPHAELGPASGGDWSPLSMASMQAPVRLVAISKRGRGDVALAWSRIGSRTDARAWLQRVRVADAVAPSIVSSRVLTGAVRAVAFAGEDVIVALAPPDAGAGVDRAAYSPLLRWTADRALVPVADANGAPWRALFSLSPDSAAEASQPTVLGLRGGRLYAIDLSCTPICLHGELDFDSLLGAPSSSGAASTDAVPGKRAQLEHAVPRAQWLQHPETGESLLALMPAHAATQRSSRSGAAWLIRQPNGRYGFARLPESRGAVSLRAVQPWPTASDPNRFALIAGGDDRTLLFPAHLNRSSVVPGLWWDPARSGHGFDLRRAGGDWQITIYTFDKRGAPMWLRGDGDIRAGRWQAGSEGLLKYRIPPGSARVEIDRRSAQSLEVDFAAASADDKCTTAARSGAPAITRATLTYAGESSVFCIEPLRLAAGGRPQIDLDGIWSARDEPAPWQLALTTQGVDPRARISAMLTYFDRGGAPRWAYAANDWHGGVADLSLLAVRGACEQCAGQPFKSTAIGELSLRATGECGAIRLAAALRIVSVGGAIGVPAGDVDLAPTALLGCY